MPKMYNSHLTIQIEPDPKVAALALADYLISCLSERRILWLVPGGSNIPLSVLVMNKIPPSLQPNLSIMLSDERYGPYDHPDSNLYQLKKAGFDPGQAKVIAVLQPKPLPLYKTVERYNKELSAVLKSAPLVVAQCGIGADGHIAGILPGSPAATAQSLVKGYQGPDFIRITLTPSALAGVSTGFVYAYGSSKLEALNRLIHEDLSISTLPSQVLKKMGSATIYTDQPVA
jgi:6-phosphogluconolactonase/glucosamine-6-phosphate isomerase/deaminase